MTALANEVGNRTASVLPLRPAAVRALRQGRPDDSTIRLLDRGAEFEGIRSIFGRLPLGGGGLVVIDGPAGVGKTALLEATRAAAVEAGLLTLHARAAELERTFAYGVVRQLFDDVLRDGDIEAEALFTSAARFAAPL